MDVNVENIKVGAIPSIRTKLETEAHLKKEAEELGEQVTPGEIPIGLRPPRLIPTGSVFIPKELVLPKQETPIEIELTEPVVDVTSIPQKLENLRVKSEISVDSSSQHPQDSINKFLLPHLDLLA